MYGLGSQAALGTTMGLFWEVPVMLSLVYIGRKLGEIGFWQKNSCKQFLECDFMENKKINELVKMRYIEIAQSE
jgi:hypothetical protein